MIRVAVATYLMIVQLAAPLFCCCASRQMTAPLQSATTTSAADSVPVGQGCCGYHATAPGRERRSPDKQVPSVPECPCPQGPSRAALASDSDAAKQFHLEQLAVGPFDILSFLTATCKSDHLGCPAPRERQALPFLSADDLLRAFHILRC